MCHYNSRTTVNLGYNESLCNEYLVITIIPHGINYFVCKITNFYCNEFVKFSEFFSRVFVIYKLYFIYFTY